MSEKKLEAVGASLAALKQALAELAELRALTTSPLVGRDEAVTRRRRRRRGDEARSDHREFPRRARPQPPARPARRVIRAFNMLAARHRGEITAEVTSAHPLDDGPGRRDQGRISRNRIGRDIAVDLNVDPAILGGLVVKIGSQMIDGSIRTKLNTLAQAMKG